MKYIIQSNIELIDYVLLRVLFTVISDSDAYEHIHSGVWISYIYIFYISYATLAIISDEIYSPGTGMREEDGKSKYGHYRHLHVCVCGCIWRVCIRIFLSLTIAQSTHVIGRLTQRLRSYDRNKHSKKIRTYVLKITL